MTNISVYVGDSADVCDGTNGTTVATSWVRTNRQPSAAEQSHARWRALHSAPDRQPIRAEVPKVRGDDTTAVVRLYDAIDSYGGPWGVSAREFVGVLDDLPDSVTTIELRINSPGGEVWEGLAILNALRAHDARFVAVVEGVAASAASFIAAGADELVMAPNSELFIHRAWGLVVGNADDMRKFAAELEHEDRNLASIYASKAGGSVDEWLARMSDETWYSADEAVAAGLADRVGGAPASDQAKNRFDLSIFSRRPAASGTQHPATEHGGGPTITPERGSAVAFSDEQLTDLRQRLELADDADGDAVLAAVDGLIEQVTAPLPASEPPALPDGVVAIDAAQLEELRADAQAGREARAEQLRARREQLVAAAINDGRIPPVRREHWLAQLDVDPGAEQVLAALTPGLVPVGEPIGSNGASDLDTEFAEYNRIYGQEATR